MGKVERTDKAAKTVESWWSLIFADGGLGHSLFKWGWPMMGGAVGAWVASATSWISAYGVAGWATAIALGILAAVWIAAGFERARTYRHLRTRDHQDSLSAEEVEKIVREHFASLASPTVPEEPITESQVPVAPQFDDRLALLLDFVALPEKQKLLHALCTRIDEMVQLHSRQELKGDPREPHWLLQEIAGMPKRLALFGADEAAIKREVAEKIDEIKNDAQYLHIMPYEEGRYVSGPAKRHWHLWNAELKVYQEHANKIPKIKPPTQKEFVERLVEIERRDADSR